VSFCGRPKATISNCDRARLRIAGPFWIYDITNLEYPCFVAEAGHQRLCHTPQEKVIPSRKKLDPEHTTLCRSLKSKARSSVGKLVTVVGNWKVLPACLTKPARLAVGGADVAAELKTTKRIDSFVNITASMMPISRFLHKLGASATQVTAGINSSCKKVRRQDLQD
jgi:hypothetical protein